MNFENDLEELEKALFETNQRIKKLESHKESVNNEIRSDKSKSQINAETMRRLERNLYELYEKREFLIKERDSKFSTY